LKKEMDRKGMQYNYLFFRGVGVILPSPHLPLLLLVVVVGGGKTSSRGSIPHQEEEG
jgi:hypothetical protein